MPAAASSRAATRTGGDVGADTCCIGLANPSKVTSMVRMSWARKLRCGILFGCLVAMRAMSLDILVEIDGITGESTDTTHPGTIATSSFQFGAANPTSPAIGGGSGPGKVSFTDITFTKSLDKASPALYLACAKGNRLKKATFYVRPTRRTSPPVEFYRIILEDVIVTSVQTSGSSGDDRPAESVSLAFAKIEFNYYEARPDGSLTTTPVKATWDITANRP